MLTYNSEYLIFNVNLNVFTSPTLNIQKTRWGNIHPPINVSGHEKAAFELQNPKTPRSYTIYGVSVNPLWRRNVPDILHPGGLSV